MLQNWNPLGATLGRLEWTAQKCIQNWPIDPFSAPWNSRPLNGPQSVSVLVNGVLEVLCRFFRLPFMWVCGYPPVIRWGAEHEHIWDLSKNSAAVVFEAQKLRQQMCMKLPRKCVNDSRSTWISTVFSEKITTPGKTFQARQSQQVSCMGLSKKTKHK